MFHHFFKLARGEQLHSIHLHNQANPRILDLGCGTGIWSIDMCEYALRPELLFAILVADLKP